MKGRSAWRERGVFFFSLFCCTAAPRAHARARGWHECCEQSGATPTCVAERVLCFRGANEKLASVCFLVGVAPLFVSHASQPPLSPPPPTLHHAPLPRPRQRWRPAPGRAPAPGGRGVSGEREGEGRKNKGGGVAPPVSNHPLSSLPPHTSPPTLTAMKPRTCAAPLTCWPRPPGPPPLRAARRPPLPRAAAPCRSPPSLPPPWPLSRRLPGGRPPRPGAGTRCGRWTTMATGG